MERRGLAARWAGRLIVAASVTLLGAAAAGAAPRAPLPGTADRNPFGLADEPAVFGPAWVRLAAEIADDRAVLGRCRADERACPDAALRFEALLGEGRGRSGRARVGAVNRAVNGAIRYVPDRVQHGRDDVWTRPLATLAAGRGDCEDMAALKYAALLQLGTAPSDLRLVIVRDIRRGSLHAVAAARVDGEWLLLDNRTGMLAADRDVAAYAALAAFAEPAAAPSAASSAATATQVAALRGSIDPEPVADLG